MSNVNVAFLQILRIINVDFSCHVALSILVLWTITVRGGSRHFERGVHKLLGSRITVFRLWPLFEFSVVASFWKFVLHSGVQPCIRPYGDTHRMMQYFLFRLKTKCLKCYRMYNTLLNYYPACRSHKQLFLQKTLDPIWHYWVREKT